MSDPKAHPEPTMEEILASIRRIISENDEEEEARKRAEAKGTADTAGAAVLELTDMVTDDGTVVSLAAARQHEQIVEATAEENIAEEPDGGDRDAMEDGSAQEERAEMTTETPKDDAAEFARSQDADSGAAAPAPGTGTEDGLVSADTAATATASFADLARSLSQEPATAGSIPLGSGRTLEDLVQEMIRPMLKAWLDQNLPRIVEQQVRREVNRMARRAENA